MSRPFYLTPGGVDRLRARVTSARAAYKAVCDDNPAALESGDTSGWHDNFAFEENQRRMHQLARLVSELESTLGRVEVLPPLKEAPEHAMLGASVSYRHLGEDEVRTVWIAGWDDGEPASGRVSYNSPLGSALIGAQPGDERDVAGTGRRVEVVDVGPSPGDA